MTDDNPRDEPKPEQMHDLWVVVGQLTFALSMGRWPQAAYWTRCLRGWLWSVTGEDNVGEDGK